MDWVDGWDGTDEVGNTFQNLNQSKGGGKRSLAIYSVPISKMDGWID